MNITHRRVRLIACVLPGMLALWLTSCGALVTTAPTITATISTTVTPPRPTPSTTGPIYQAPLMGQAAGWPTAAVCQATAQGMVVKPSGGQAYICLAPAPAIADASITVTVEHLSGTPTHAFGIALRHNAPKSYYFFGIDEAGRVTFEVVVNDVGHSVIPFQPAAAIRRGAGVTNTLRVVAQGQTITLYVNGTAVGQATLSTFASGTIGLRGVNDGAVRFTQLIVAAA
jgi:hypothetical protein